MGDNEIHINEEKQKEIIAREEARLARLGISDDAVDAPAGSSLNGSGDNLTAEEREMRRLNKHWLTDAPKVSAGLTTVPAQVSPQKKEDNNSPRKGAIVITRPSFAPKGSAAKALEISGETESQMLERRLREAKAKAYKKEKQEKEHSAWKEKEKERAKQAELQIQARKHREQEERAKLEKEAEIRREKERKDLDERAIAERARALKDSDPAVHGSVSSSSTSWNTSGEFDVQLTEEEQIEAAKKEEARLKAHWL